jgi:molybdenum cofactor guanylyltransferase
LTACDMPFLNGGVIRFMVDAAQGQDVISPRIGGRLQPLHAMYSRRCLPVIEELLTQDDLKIINIFPRTTLREIAETDLSAHDPTLRFVVNLNTPEDVARARVIAGDLESETP